MALAVTFKTLVEMDTVCCDAKTNESKMYDFLNELKNSAMIYSYNSSFLYMRSTFVILSCLFVKELNVVI